MVGVIAAILGALAGAGAGYLSWAAQNRRTLRVEHAQWLREKRLLAYARVWRQLEPTAVFSPESDLTYGKLDAISHQLRRWYFRSGGILMPADTREVYFALQGAIVRAASLVAHDVVLRRADEVLSLRELHVAEQKAQLDGADVGATIATWPFGKDPGQD